MGAWLFSDDGLADSSHYSRLPGSRSRSHRPRRIRSRFRRPLRPPRPFEPFIYPVGSVVKAFVRLRDGSRWPIPGVFEILRNVRGEGTRDEQSVVRQYAVKEADCLFLCNTWFIDNEDIDNSRPLDPSVPVIPVP